MLVVNRLVETHIFSFVVGRAFVTDIEKLKISSKTRSLSAVQVLKFFSEVTKVSLSQFYVFFSYFFICFLYLQRFFSMQDGISPGANLLTSVEILVSGVCFWESFFAESVFIRRYRIHVNLFTEKYVIVFPSVICLDGNICVINTGNCVRIVA